MRIFNTIASTLLASASLAAYSDAFTPISCIGNRAAAAGVVSASTSGLWATEQPCDIPSDVEETVLADATPLRNAVVTNVHGDKVTLGDMMVGTSVSEKKYDTSVVVFLRHMG